MPTPLRAFLMLRSGAGEWSVTVHRDLEDLLAAWKSRPADDQVTGVVHVGFDRPPSREFETFASERLGCVLITGAAKFALPADFQTSKSSLGTVRAMPVFLGTRGWDYIVEDDVDEPIIDESGSAPTVQGWVRDFLSMVPDASGALTGVNIFDDPSYLAHEADLPRALRKQTGLYRLEKLLGTERSDPCDLARAAPPWLADRALNKIDLSVRVSHVFGAMGLSTVRDLAGLSVEELLRKPNFGRRSITDLVESLEGALNEGPPYGPDVVNSDRLTLLTMIRQTFLGLEDRASDVLQRRMGLDRSAEILADIGDEYGVTRERIRQIEAKAVKRVRRIANWTELLTAKLTSLLVDRSYPLPILGLEGADPWFTGIGQASGALGYILENICDCSAQIVAVDGIEYLGRISQDDWEAILQKARRLLESAAGNGWSENHCRSLVDGLLPDNGRDFREILWERASSLCHFTADEEGLTHLVSYGRGIEHYVLAILAESDRPLHFSEIADLASVRSAREVDLRRAHNAAATVALLLGRGTYGLHRHLPLDPAGLTELGEEAEEVVVEGPPGRQWHTSEILAALIERGTRGALAADKYVVDVALQDSAGLDGLGRMVWTSGHDTAKQSAARIDVHQAIITILQQASRPLSTHEIRQRLIALRGVNETFQIVAGDPVIRIGPALWGLNDRDLPVKRADQRRLTDTIVDALHRSQVGIHVSELDELGNFPLGLSPTMTASLCAADSRMRINIAQYIYLAEWGEPRRESISEATETVLSLTEAPMSFEKIVEKIVSRIGRSCDRAAISASLQMAGAEFNQSTGEWSRSKSNDAFLDDDSSAMTLN